MKFCDWTGDTPGTEERCNKEAHEFVELEVVVVYDKDTSQEYREYNSVNRWFCPEHWEKTPWGRC
jgi:hypothetical protein